MEQGGFVTRSLSRNNSFQAPGFSPSANRLTFLLVQWRYRFRRYILTQRRQQRRVGFVSSPVFSPISSSISPSFALQLAGTVIDRETNQRRGVIARADWRAWRVVWRVKSLTYSQRGGEGAPGVLQIAERELQYFRSSRYIVPADWKPDRNHWHSKSLTPFHLVSRFPPRRSIPFDYRLRMVFLFHVTAQSRV